MLIKSADDGQGGGHSADVMQLLVALVAAGPVTPSPLAPWAWGITVIVVILVVAPGMKRSGRWSWLTPRSNG